MTQLLETQRLAEDLDLAQVVEDVGRHAFGQVDEAVAAADVDAADAASVDVGLVGDGADEVLRLHAVVLAHLHAVGLQALVAPSPSWSRIIASRISKPGILRAPLLALRRHERTIALGQVGERGGDVVETRLLLASEVAHEVTEKIQVLTVDGLGDALLELLRATLHHVGVGGQCHGLEWLAVGPLDGPQHRPFPRRDEEDRLAGASSAACAADTVDVGLGVVGYVEVDDVADAIDVESAGRHIGGDDDVELLVLQSLHRALAQSLAHVPVERRTGEAACLQLLGQLHGGHLGAHEDQHGVEILDLEDAGQRVQLVDAADLPVVLRHRGDRGRLRLDLHVHRIAQMLTGDPGDGVGKGGREQRHLFLWRRVAQDLFDVVEEAHAQHLVGLVEHDRTQHRQVEGVAP